MQERLQVLNSEDLETKMENEKLLQVIILFLFDNDFQQNKLNYLIYYQEKEELEEKLIISQDNLEESRSYINQLRAQQRKEKQERAM